MNCFAKELQIYALCAYDSENVKRVLEQHFLYYTSTQHPILHYSLNLLIMHKMRGSLSIMDHNYLVRSVGNKHKSWQNMPPL